MAFQIDFWVILMNKINLSSSFAIANMIHIETGIRGQTSWVISYYIGLQMSYKVFEVSWSDWSLILHALRLSSCRHLDSNGGPLLCLLGERFSRQYVRTSFQKGSPVLTRYNDVIKTVDWGFNLGSVFEGTKISRNPVCLRKSTVPMGHYILSKEHS
jgi:hypothetical protein